MCWSIRSTRPESFRSRTRWDCRGALHSDAPADERPDADAQQHEQGEERDGEALALTRRVVGHVDHVVPRRHRDCDERVVGVEQLGAVTVDRGSPSVLDGVGDLDEAGATRVDIDRMCSGSSVTTLNDRASCPEPGVTPLPLDSTTVSSGTVPSTSALRRAGSDAITVDFGIQRMRGSACVRS